MTEKCSPLPKVRVSPEGQNPSERLAVQTREAATKGLRAKDEVLSVFLKKYNSGTVMEAVQKEAYAACELMETLMAAKKFGNLNKMAIQEALLKAIECHHDAADTFVKNARRFRGILEPSVIRDALVRATFNHNDLNDYFRSNYQAQFSRLYGADEVLERMDRKNSQSH